MRHRKPIYQAVISSCKIIKGQNRIIAILVCISESRVTCLRLASELNFLCICVCLGFGWRSEAPIFNVVQNGEVWDGTTCWWWPRSAHGVTPTPKASSSKHTQQKERERAHSLLHYLKMWNSNEYKKKYYFPWPHWERGINWNVSPKSLGTLRSACPFCYLGRSCKALLQ